MEKPIGKCSNCGGVVTMFHGPWAGLKPPQATCSRCGAVKADCPDVIIPMTPPPKITQQEFLDELTKRAN